MRPAPAFALWAATALACSAPRPSVVPAGPPDPRQLTETQALAAIQEALARAGLLARRGLLVTLQVEAPAAGREQSGFEAPAAGRERSGVEAPAAGREQSDVEATSGAGERSEADSGPVSLEVDVYFAEPPFGIEWVTADDRARYGALLPGGSPTSPLRIVTASGDVGPVQVLVLDDRVYGYEGNAVLIQRGATGIEDAEQRVRRDVTDFVHYVRDQGATM